MKQTILADDAIKLEIVRQHNEGSSIRTISRIYGVPKSTVSRFLRRESYQEWWEDFDTHPLLGEINDHHTNIRQLKSKRYLLTSAQNNTFVHGLMWSTLTNMADHLDAELLVGTYSYNLNGFQNLAKSDGDWFDSKLTPYIVDEPVLLADDLLWCGELNILPTAVNPISGLQAYTKHRSGILPHAKQQLETVPTHKQNDPKFIYTTGSVTKRNYIQKKTGQKASFHHIFGALLVEMDCNGDWFVRQLQANKHTGEIQDLNNLYKPDGTVEHKHVEAIQWGDIHVEKLHNDIAWPQFGLGNEDSMLEQLKPKYQFIHDVLDSAPRNHHNIHDPYFRFIRHHSDTDNVEGEINKMVNLLDSIQRPKCQTVVVESNHDLALTRWLREADYKTDPENALFFLQCQLRMYQAMHEEDREFHLLEWLYQTKTSTLQSTPIFLKTDESFRVCDIECGSHGDRGANGARGTPTGFAKLDSKYNIGHTHTAAIKDGVYVAGLSADFDKMDYAKGPSSWSHSNIVTYPNGSRTIVTVKNGKWRLEE